MSAPESAPSAAPDARAALRDACPRCGGGSHCGLHDPRPCACTTVTLDASTLQALRARYRGCLCIECLRALARGEPVDASGPAAPTPGPAARDAG